MVRETKLYDQLGVGTGASEREINKAYRKLAKQHHPDRPGGNAAKFREAQAAHEVLADETKRRQYDQFGQAGLDGSRPSAFPGFRTSHRDGPVPRPTQAPPIQFELKCTLEEAFTGCTKKLKVKHRKLCAACSGNGGSGSRQTCSGCRGNGSQIRMRALGPGMMQQVVSTCQECKGTGNVFPADSRCHPCSGSGTTTGSEVVEVYVPPGVAEGQKIVCMEKGNEAPGLNTGDLVVVVHLKPHAAFKRRGANLFLTRHISLASSLTGCCIEVAHLDGTLLRLGSKGVLGNEVKVLRGHGMPLANQTPGDLYVEFVVDFPRKLNLSAEGRESLARLLDGEVVLVPDDVQEMETVDLPTEQAKWRSQAQQDADSSEFEPQCRTQ